MKRSILQAAFVLAALAAGSAGAATVSECIADVSGAKAAIVAAQTFVNAKDQVALAAKADGAMQKLDKGKFGDAATVLGDMASKVTTLVTADKPKLDAGEGAAISALIGIAQTCVAQLMTQ